MVTRAERRRADRERKQKAMLDTGAAVKWQGNMSDTAKEMQRVQQPSDE